MPIRAMKKILYLTMAAISFSFFGGKASAEAPVSGKPNARKDIALSEAQREFVTKGNGFALNLVGKLYKGKSFICSPLSLQFALGMVNSGAQGKTSDEICAMLGFGAGAPEEINAYSKVLADGLMSVDKTTSMDIANILVYNTNFNGQDGVSLHKPFVGSLKKYYDAGIETFDFKADKNAALGRINGWCSEKTHKMIPSILDDVNPLSLCYILNAVYFKGMWANKFNKNRTREEEFFPEKGGSKKVEMMHLTDDFGYTANENWKSLTMPYGNKAYRLTAYLPEKGKTVADVLATLDAESLARTSGVRYTDEVRVSFPKFETESTMPLNDILKEMGMKKAFRSGAAELKLMSPFADRISSVLQKAKIKLDEEGTEAAAVTVVAVEGCTAIPNPPEPKKFIADHPFFYVITEVSTGAVIFAGCYAGD